MARRRLKNPSQSQTEPDQHKKQKVLSADHVAARAASAAITEGADSWLLADASSDVCVSRLCLLRLESATTTTTPPNRADGNDKISDDAWYQQLYGRWKMGGVCEVGAAVCVYVGLRWLEGGRTGETTYARTYAMEL